MRISSIRLENCTHNSSKFFFLLFCIFFIIIDELSGQFILNELKGKWQKRLFFKNFLLYPGSFEKLLGSI